MNNGSYSVEFKVKAGLAGFVIVFLVLAAVVGHTLNWSLLAIVTLLFFLVLSTMLGGVASVGFLALIHYAGKRLRAKHQHGGIRCKFNAAQ